MTKRINSPDTKADIELRECLDKYPRTSFNMIAGAGSGKTTSLVKALSHIVTTKGDILKRRGQQVACITYTEIAAKEIWNDVENNSLAHVSTIHSFLWAIIRSFQKDIKKWVVQRIVEKQSEIQTKIDNPRTRTRDRLVKQMDKLNAQIGSIESISCFNYGTGSNYTNGILGHDDIIKLVTFMINEHKMLGTIISQKYPYIFVDESQDTFPNIVSSLRKIETEHTNTFCLGFFGDSMQKIFPTGVGEILVETNWEKITKPENFRCPQQVLQTINAIRKPADGLEQVGGRIEDGKHIEGSSSIFILPADKNRTPNVKKVQKWGSDRFDDISWLSDDIKILVIVHRMAAIRLGFEHLYSAMNDDSPSAFKDGLLDGTSWPLKPFMLFILPLVAYQNQGLKFEVLNILRDQCPKLSNGTLKGTALRTALAELKTATDQLVKIMDVSSKSTVLDALMLIKNEELMVLDERIIDHINNTVAKNALEDDEDDSVAIEIDAMQRFFRCPANEFLGYKKYSDDESPFATQQGIKGAEFEKVITILDDDEGTHNLFSYDKFFGLAPLSSTDEKNITEGKDNVIARTRRLFYVSCSRARKDLIVIYFTSDVEQAKKSVAAAGIFRNENIFTLQELAKY